MPEREEPERHEQEREKEDMTRGQHEDDHGDGESDGEQTHENPSLPVGRPLNVRALAQVSVVSR